MRKGTTPSFLHKLSQTGRTLVICRGEVFSLKGEWSISQYLQFLAYIRPKAPLIVVFVGWELSDCFFDRHIKLEYVAIYLTYAEKCCSICLLIGWENILLFLLDAGVCRSNWGYHTIFGKEIWSIETVFFGWGWKFAICIAICMQIRTCARTAICKIKIFEEKVFLQSLKKFLIK